MEQKTGPSLLIVEDDATMRKFLVDYLSVGRYQVVAVEDGRKAIKALHQQKFDLAIVGLRLPFISGIELMEKAKIYQPDLKTIIITAYPSLETLARSIKLGAIDYLIKPLSLDELDTLMEEVLGEMPSYKRSPSNSSEPRV